MEPLHPLTGRVLKMNQRDRARKKYIYTNWKCQRCLRGEEARYRAYTDTMDIKVCASCAEEARKLGIPIEALVMGKRHINS